MEQEPAGVIIYHGREHPYFEILSGDTENGRFRWCFVLRDSTLEITSYELSDRLLNPLEHGGPALFPEEEHPSEIKRIENPEDQPRIHMNDGSTIRARHIAIFPKRTFHRHEQAAVTPEGKPTTIPAHDFPAPERRIPVMCESSELKGLARLCAPMQRDESHAANLKGGCDMEKEPSESEWRNTHSLDMKTIDYDGVTLTVRKTLVDRRQARPLYQQLDPPAFPRWRFVTDWGAIYASSYQCLLELLRLRPEGVDHLTDVPYALSRTARADQHRWPFEHAYGEIPEWQLEFSGERRVFVKCEVRDWHTRKEAPYVVENTAAPATAVDTQKNVSAFAHSPNYRSVTWQGNEYQLTPTQAAVIQALQNGGTLSEAELIEEVYRDNAPSSVRFDKLFQTNARARNAALWGKLIMRNKGYYSLNI